MSILIPDSSQRERNVFNTQTLVHGETLDLAAIYDAPEQYLGVSVFFWMADLGTAETGLGIIKLIIPEQKQIEVESCLIKTAGDSIVTTVPRRILNLRSGHTYRFAYATQATLDYLLQKSMPSNLDFREFYEQNLAAFVK